MGLSAGDATAIYAAVVGTGALLWQAWTWWADRRPSVRLLPPRIEGRGPVAVVGDQVVGGFDTLVVHVVNDRGPTVVVDRVAVERPTPYAARFVDLTTRDGRSIEPGHEAVYTVGMSLLEDDDADREVPVRFTVTLATPYATYWSGPYPLTWARSSPPGPPKLKRATVVRRAWWTVKAAARRWTRKLRPA